MLREGRRVHQFRSVPDADPAPRPLMGFEPPRELVDRAQRGEPGALNELVAALTPCVLRAVGALLGPEHPDLDDVAQEALLAVVDALPAFRGESSLVHFAVRITTRRATRARRRSRSVLSFVERFYRGEHPLTVPAPTPLGAWVAHRRRELLAELLTDLPPAQADAMMLRVALGHTLEEVAGLTATPVNTIRSRLRLAKETLRRRIARDPQRAELLAVGEEP
jgi:RNA polymerase sigma factor (sigma-70 family)